MSQTRWVNLIAGAAITLGAVSGASADQGQAWSGNSDEVRAIVAEMLADAETRTSLLQSGATAGHDDKFFLASGDGNFRLNVGGQVQFRYYLNFRNDDDGAADDDFESGFQTRRTKLTFDGNVIDPNLFFKITGAFDRDEGNFGLEDAYVGYQWDNGWQAQWGQFKLPYMREELVSSRYQLAADRSLMNEVFNQGWSQGVQLNYKAEDWQVLVAFSDGFNSQNSDFSVDRSLAGNSFFASGESDWAFTGRGEYKFAGTWEQFKDFTSKSGSDFGFLLGAAAHYEGGDASSITAGGSYDFLGLTCDFSLEGDGWNLYAAAVGTFADFNEGYNGDDYGFLVQGGIMIPETSWEVFARYDALLPDDEARALSSDDDWFSTVTAGVNYYYSGHAAKFTADVQWFIDDLNALSVPNTGIGYLGSDDENEFTVRFQFQLLF